MKRNGLSIHHQADYLYPGAVALTLFATAAVLWMRASHGVIHSVWHLPHTVYTRGSLYVAFLAIGMLAWRVWLACRYRAYSPVNDRELPAVTIVIPSYNEGHQILDTVRSVMASDYPRSRMQVICVDDGSVDDTWRWMLQARHEFPQRLHLIRQRKNGGKRHALMAGFRRATGSIFVTIDSDSEVLPHTLRHLISPFAADPRVGAVAGNVRVLNRSDGTIPKMMDVNFTMSFDFTRSGQSVYGGVLCTPGALSAYRASVVRPHLPKWAEQSFMGVPATIGEDRALSNCVLASGYRIVYQREAVVLTKMPDTYNGLRRMLLRWARSNVRENLVMATYMFRRFRHNDTGEGWVRFFGILQIFRMVAGEALKIGIIANLFVDVFTTLTLLAIGCLVTSVVPAVVYQIRHGSWSGWRWSLPYGLFWLSGLSWISAWGLLSAARSGWLTRSLPVPARNAGRLMPSRGTIG